MNDNVSGLTFLAMAVLFWYGIYRLIRIILKGGLRFTRPAGTVATSGAADSEHAARGTGASSVIEEARLVVPTWLRITRHIVGFYMVMGFTWIFAHFPNVIRWAVVPTTILLLSILISGALSLFFTASQKRNGVRNFAWALWIGACVWLAVVYVAHLQDEAEAKAGAVAPQASSFNAAPAKNVPPPAVVTQGDPGAGAGARRSFSFEEAQGKRASPQAGKQQP